MKGRETIPAVSATLGARAAMPKDLLERAVEGINIEDLLRSMSGRLDTPGQDAFAKEAAADRAQIAAQAAAFAADPRYAALFEWLLDITLRRPMVLWGLGDSRLEYADRREGANSVVWQLLQAVAEGRSEQHPIREGQIP